MSRLLLACLFLSLPVHGEEAKLYLELGHSHSVNSLAFSRDGRFILTGSLDQTARLWDSATGSELRVFTGHTGGVLAVAFSPDGRLVATGAADHTARLWDAASGKEIRRLEGHTDGVAGVAFSPDGRLLATASHDTTARIWEAATGKVMGQPLAHKNKVNAVAFSPDGRHLLTGAGNWIQTPDNQAHLWNVATGQPERLFEGHTGDVTAVAFSADGRLIATASGDESARLWDFASGREVRRFTPKVGRLSSVAFSPDSRYLLVSMQSLDSSLWDVQTGSEVRRFSGRAGGVTLAAIFSPDGRSVLQASYYSAWLFDTATGALVHKLEGHSEEIFSVAISPDARYLVTSGQRQARIWDTTTGSQVRSLNGHDDLITSVAFSTDGRQVLTGSWDSTARLWDPATGQEFKRFAGNGDKPWIKSVALSRTGRLALTGAESILHLYDVTTGAELRQFKGHQDSIESVAFSASEKTIVTGSRDHTARLWDTSNGTELRRFEGHSGNVTSVAFSPDDQFVLTGSEDNTARLWDVLTGKEVRRFTGHTGYVDSVAFSPDGKYVLTGSHDATVCLWDASTGTELRRMRGHASWVLSVRFSSDGRKILSGGWDGTARLWDSDTGALLATMVSFRDGGWVALNPAGRYDASDPDSAPGLHFVSGDDVIQLNQLKQRFYTPNLLARIARGETFSDIADLTDVKLVPAVEVQPPTAGSTEATIRLTNRGGGIGKVIVRVNGREIAANTRGQFIDANARSAEMKVNLAGATLSPTGSNVIEVFAENGDGVLRSRGIVAAWHVPPSSRIAPPRMFAVVAGVSDFDNPSLNLRYPAKDATAFAHALTLAAGRLFGAANTHISLLASGTPQEPTKENLRRAFAQISAQASAEDVLVVYLAGHGVAARSVHDEYYFLTRDARSIDIDRDAALRAVSTVSSAELQSWLAHTNMPLKQVVVLDTCAAGAALGEMAKLADRRELSPDQVRAIELLKDSTGSWILMGSAADAVSYEANRYAQGLLTYAVLQGMKGAALEGDQVEVSRLFGFAQREVAELAQGIGGVQRPVLSAPKGQTFPIGMLTLEDRNQIHLATQKAQLLRARVVDDDLLDSLKLEPAVRAELRAASLPGTRGTERQDPRIAYLDAVVDDFPDALIPQVRYIVAADSIQARIRMIRNGKPVSEHNVQLPSADHPALSKALATEIIALSEALK